MIITEIREAIKKRIEINDEWEYGVEQCWNEEIKILSKDINETIDFLYNCCTADEFSWLSEVFTSIAKITQSREFIDCLYRVADKYSAECSNITF